MENYNKKFRTNKKLKITNNCPPTISNRTKSFIKTIIHLEFVYEKKKTKNVCMYIAPIIGDNLQNE